MSESSSSCQNMRRPGRPPKTLEAKIASNERKLAELNATLELKSSKNEIRRLKNKMYVYRLRIDDDKRRLEEARNLM